MSRREAIKAVEAEIPRLRRYARYLARDTEAADDLVQDCLVRAIAKIHLWQPGTNLRAWLFTILHNIFINQKARKKRAPLSADPHGPALVVPIAGNQEDHVRLSEVVQALATLGDDHRQMIFLIVLEGLSYEEVAQVLDLPIGTVRSRLSRARSALQKAADSAAEKGRRGKRRPGKRSTAGRNRSP
jgi:RNA polymerase sigma-70 factor (ECF subfamily)